MSAEVAALQLHKILELAAASDCDTDGGRSSTLWHSGLQSVARCIHSLHLAYFVCNVAQSSDESSVFQPESTRLGSLGFVNRRDGAYAFIGTKAAAWAWRIVGDTKRLEVDLPASILPLVFSESDLRTRATRPALCLSTLQASAFLCASTFACDSRFRFSGTFSWSISYIQSNAPNASQST